MQEPALIFLALIAGHLVGDFLLQTQRDVDGKNAFDWRAYARHGTVHYLGTVAALAAFVGISPWNGRAQLVVIGIVAVHMVIDVGKPLLSRAMPGRYSVTLFLLDQLAHVVVLFVAGWVFLLQLPPSGLLEPLTPPVPVPVVALIVVYVAVTIAGGQLIRIALIPFARELDDQRGGDQLAFAGMYIGWLERFLVLTALLAGSYTSVGLIVAAKSIFRFPDLGDRPFAEYFLIGTLMSVALAVVGALVAQMLI